VKLEAIRSASKRFLVTRETATVLPSIPAFAQMIDAAIDLYHSVDPDEKKSIGRRMAYWLLRLTLVMISDVTMFWKTWFR
jgi:hypothetical protein